MRLVRWSLRNLWRNPRRTIFTGLSLAVSLFLFSTLVSVIRSLDANIEAVGRLPNAVVIHRSGFTHLLPESYAARIRRIPGVKLVVPTLYYGGAYGEVRGPQDSFPSLAIDATDRTREMWGQDFEVTDEAWRAFVRERTAALVGPQLAEKYGWQPGRRITLHGTMWQVDLTFTVVGTAAFRTDRATFLLHREYLDQALGGIGLVSMFWVQVEDVPSLPRIAKLIDAEFENSPDRVRTMSHKQLVMSFMAMIGNVRGLVGGIAMLVIVAVLFVTANSIALSARERLPEIALLKVLGFGRSAILFGVMCEALALSALGGLFGSAAAFVLFHRRTFSLGFGPLSGFQIDWPIVVIGFGASALVGLLAALFPALHAMRLRVTDVLRSEA